VLAQATVRYLDAALKNRSRDDGSVVLLLRMPLHYRTPQKRCSVFLGCINWRYNLANVSSAMRNPVTRSFIAALAAFAAFWYVYWVPIAITLDIAHGRFHGMWIIRVLESIGAAVVAAAYTWRHKSLAPQGPISCIFLGAIIAGGLGFSAGWFGPMFFNPGSQGPVIGIITGPLGFLVGSVGGAYWALWGRNNSRASNS
jgi:hypothetical protein